MKNLLPILGVVAASIGIGIVLVTLSDNNDELLVTPKKLVENGSPILGDKDAPITILEWGDYQCTFCFKFHRSTFKIIQQDYISTGEVRLVFKDFPLNGPDSILAAEASYCADEQERYWQFHNQLYENWAGERTGWITRHSLNTFAQNIGLNLDKFNECLDDKRYHQRVLETHQFGKDIGIDATPSFLIFNDEKVIKIRGNQPPSVFKKAIEELVL